MASSGVRNFQLTLEELSELAFSKIGQLGPDGLTAAQRALARKYANVVNQRLLIDADQRLFTHELTSDLYLTSTPTVVRTTTLAGTGTYLLARDVDEVRAFSVMIKDGASGYESQVLPMDQNEYDTLEDKTLSARPNRFLIEYNQSYTDSTSDREYAGRLQIRLFPIPDVSTYILTYRKVKTLEDWNAAANTGGHPPKWQRAFIYALAFELAVDGGLDMGTRKELNTEYRDAIARLSQTDVEHGELSFSPRLSSPWRRR